MNKKKFGKTDLEVTPICFGAWEIGGFPFFQNFDEEKSIQLVQEAFEAGVNFFDTAPVYGFGHSEKVLGKAIKGFRDEIIISNKFGLVWEKEDLNAIQTNGSKKSILKEIDISLKRLDVDYIDLYLMHWPDKDHKTPIGESIETLEKIKESGKIRYYGVSNFKLGQFKEAQKYGEISSLQSHYSLLTHSLDKEHLPYLIENNLGFQAYSPLERGVLTNQSIAELKKRNDLAVDWSVVKTSSPELEKVEKLKELSTKYDVSFPAFIIGATLARPGITTTIVGTTKIAHLNEAIQGSKLKISDEDLKTIEEIIS